MDKNQSATSSNSDEDFLKTPHDDNIVTNKQGHQVIQNINKLEKQQWYSQTTNNWKKWTER
jgi:hypothetical protein